MRAWRATQAGGFVNPRCRMRPAGTMPTSWHRFRGRHWMHIRRRHQSAIRQLCAIARTHARRLSATRNSCKLSKNSCNNLPASVTSQHRTVAQNDVPAGEAERLTAVVAALKATGPGPIESVTLMDPLEDFPWSLLEHAWVANVPGYAWQRLKSKTANGHPRRQLLTSDRRPPYRSTHPCGCCRRTGRPRGPYGTRLPTSCFSWCVCRRC